MLRTCVGQSPHPKGKGGGSTKFDEGGGVFRWGASFLSGGAPHGDRALVLIGGEFKKNHRMGGYPPYTTALWETPKGIHSTSCLAFIEKKLF